MITDINNNDMKPVQDVVLSIYKVVKAVCDENNIRFFAIGGTAIGAVRHKGFIPWDDDIDIVMPRVDYERFSAIANDLLPERYLFRGQGDQDAPYMDFGMVQDSMTARSSESDAEGAITGIYLDIMPLDGAPSSRMGFASYMWLLKNIHRLKSAIFYNNSTDGRAKAVVRSLVRIFFSERWLRAVFLRLVARYPFDDSTRLARTWSFDGHDGLQAKAHYYRSDFEEYIEMPFEDTLMRMPVGFDRYLNSLYPNYMTLPPPEKRVPRHSGALIDLTHSYRYHLVKKDGGRIGYANGCFDMFHVGHLNILRLAKKHCDYLIVGVNSDDLMELTKGKRPVVGEIERAEILSSLKYVDEVHIVGDSKKKFEKAYKLHEFDTVFVGDDHKGEKAWLDLEAFLREKGSNVHYFKYTSHTSSTKLRAALDDIIDDRKA